MMRKNAKIHKNNMLFNQKLKEFDLFHSIINTLILKVPYFSPGISQSSLQTKPKEKKKKNIYKTHERKQTNSHS